VECGAGGRVALWKWVSSATETPKAYRLALPFYFYLEAIAFLSLSVEMFLLFRVYAYASDFSNRNISLPLLRLQHLTVLSR
jgi:hypothetical protein